METLFKEQDYLEVKFPDPQYLGAKYTLRAWIKQFIPSNINCALDAFSGSQSVSFLFKQLGFRTITNDFLNCNNQIGIALIENQKETLNSDDINILFSQNPNPQEFSLMESLFANLFFEPSEAAFLDAFRANLNRLSNKYKKALAFAVMNRSMTRKVTMGHFAHTQALNYASDPARIKRNKSLIMPLKDIFLELLPIYNRAVFNNSNDNQSYNENILNLLPKLSNVDLVYFDPPYCDSHADYQSFYHLLETFTEYWKDKEFVNGTNRYEPKRVSGFDKKSEIIPAFASLFEKAKDIPYWLISYNDRSYPDIETLCDIAAQYKKIHSEYKQYQVSRGGKGSVAGSHEILIQCKPK